MPQKLLLRWTFAFSMMIIVLSGGLILYRLPVTLSLSVGPPNSPILAYAGEIAAALDESRQPLRLKLRVTDGSVTSSILLDERKTDLAIVRSDDETSKFARSIVLLQKQTLFAIARIPPKESARKSPASQSTRQSTPAANKTVTSQLAAAKPAPAAGDTPTEKPTEKPDADDEADANSAVLLGLFGKMKDGSLKGGLLSRRGANDLPIVTEALEHYGIPVASGALKRYNRKAAEAAFQSGNLDFLIILAHPSEPNIRSLVRTSRKALGKSFVLAAPPGAKGLAYQLKHLELSTLPAGVFGGNPPLPKSDLESVAITHEIVATTKVNDRTAALLTKILTDLRTQLRGSDDGEFTVELPTTADARRYLPHPGTVAQINGDSKTFLDTYSDLIWLALFGVGLAGSAISSLMSWLGLGKKTQSTET
jgi:TRAP-type uncharacterized transport system substrate-binding protein